MEGCNGMPIEAAHVRLGSHSGMGQKPDDWRAVSLCRFHHAAQHSAGEASFWREYKEAGHGTVDDLIVAFCKASPKAAEIARVRKEREGG